MRRSIPLIVLLVTAVVTDNRPCQAQEAKGSEKRPASAKQITSLMQMKLEKSKALLEGLALEDYGAIAKNSRGLHLLSLESGWNVIQTPEYTKQSSEFKRSTDLITQAAEQKDLGRATLGYVALTVRCVECHIYLRQQRSGDVQPDASPDRN